MDPLEASPSGKQGLSIVVKSLRLWEQEAQFPSVSLGVTVCGAASMVLLGHPFWQMLNGALPISQGQRSGEEGACGFSQPIFHQLGLH